MSGIRNPASSILKRPGAFAMRVLRSFRANQGYLLAGAVAYNTLLSMLPLLILILIGMANFVEESALRSTLGHYLEWIVPGQAEAIMGELALFLEHRHVVGWVLVGTLLFFSSLAFTVLENAMSVIFYHRVAIRRRSLLVSLLIPFVWIFFLALGALIVTFVSGALQVMGQESVEILGRTRSLGGLSRFLLYLIGITGEIIVLTSIYMVMPVGRLSWRHALVGGVTAALLVGSDPPHAGVVLLDDVAGQDRLRVAHHRDRGAAEPGDRGDGAAAGRAGDRRVRAHPRRARSGRAAADADGLAGSSPAPHLRGVASCYFPARYCAIARCRSVNSSQGSRQISFSAARCRSAPATSPVMRYVSPMYSCAPRWRGSSSIARR